MVAVNQNDLRVKNAQNLIQSLSEGDSYAFMGRPSQWESDIAAPTVARQEAGDMSPPYPDNNWKEYYRTWNQMLSLKGIRPEEVKYMIPKLTWTSGLVYDMYRHDYNKFTRSYSNAQSLYDALFVVVNQNRFVYVCLDNNNNSQSLVEPLVTTDEPFYTTDGYQWLRMYRISDTDYRKFITNNYMPITDDLINKKTEGAVYTIKIDSPGDEYTTRPPGKADEIPLYFCRIVGDGQDGVAMVSIFNGRIDRIRISDPGYGYTYAKLKFEANHVYDSLSDLYQDKNALNPMGNGGLRTTVIISPPGGWGYETNSVGFEPSFRDLTTTLARQLGGTRVGVFSDFKSREADFVEDTTFRQAGIIQDVQGFIFDGAPRRTISTYTTVKVSRTTNSDSSQYITGEMITQNSSHGQVVGVTTNEGDIYIHYIQDPFLHCDPVTGNLHKFEGSDIITGDTSGVTSTPDVTYTEYFKNQQFQDGYSLGEIMRYRGNFTYIDNTTTIKRERTQTERLSMIVEY